MTQGKKNNHQACSVVFWDVAGGCAHSCSPSICVLYHLLLAPRQCEQQESKTASEMTELLHRLSSLQEENTRLAWDKSNLADVLKRTQCELELEKQANRY